MAVKIEIKVKYIFFTQSSVFVMRNAVFKTDKYQSCEIFIIFSSHRPTILIINVDLMAIQFCLEKSVR